MSQVLAAQRVFVAADAYPAASEENRLERVTTEAAQAGYPIRVAVLAFKQDLGAVSGLWRQPQSYARFLGLELSVAEHDRLLVVMPNGSGFYQPGHTQAQDQAQLRRIPSTPANVSLAARAAQQVQNLAAAAGHPLPSRSSQAAASRPASRTATTRAGGVSGGPQSLAARLAILRRPQTALDRTVSPSSVLSGLTDHRHTVPGLMRLAATVRTTSGVVRVFVIVRAAQTPTGAGRPASLDDQDQAWAVTIGARGANATSGLTAAQLDAPGVVASENGVIQSLVPDGVTRVRWVFNGQAADGASQRRPITIHPTVRDNVAIAPAVQKQGTLTAATWYDARGRQIATWASGQSPTPQP